MRRTGARADDVKAAAANATNRPKVNEIFSLRPAKEEDVPALESLIPLSVRALNAPFYSPAQIEAALGPVFGVDRQLIGDGTYSVVEHSDHVVGCGGWSRRRAAFGGDQARVKEEAALDPAHDPARIRAFLSTPPGCAAGWGA